MEIMEIKFFDETIYKRFMESCSNQGLSPDMVIEMALRRYLGIPRNNKTLVQVEGFYSHGVKEGGGKGAIMRELEKSDMVSKRIMQRKYRWIKKHELEKAAMELKESGKIEILREMGQGRPATFFRKVIV